MITELLMQFAVYGSALFFIALMGALIEGCWHREPFNSRVTKEWYDWELQRHMGRRERD